MKIAIHSGPLASGHQFRGIGTYTRLLIQAMQKYHPEHSYIVDSSPYQTDADVVHYPFYDLFFLTLPFLKTKPTIVTIHDVIPLLYPQAYPPGIRGLIKAALQRLSLESVTRIVTDSDQSSRDVVTYLRQPQTKVSTIYLAADEAYSPASLNEIDAVLHRYGLYQPYCLYVGDINYNKNPPGARFGVSFCFDRIF